MFERRYECTECGDNCAASEMGCFVQDQEICRECTEANAADRIVTKELDSCDVCGSTTACQHA